MTNSGEHCSGVFGEQFALPRIGERTPLLYIRGVRCSGCSKDVGIEMRGIRFQPSPCGCGDYWLTDWNTWLCSWCHPKPEGGSRQ